MISKLKADLGFFKNSLKDWSTKRKIIVIESDDWGSIRMPSISAQENLKNNGIAIDKCPFLKYDNFDRVDDFKAIEKSFDEFYSLVGKRPLITANYILANPDFEKIKNSNYLKYYRKYFWEELEQKDELDLYKKQLNSLIEKGYFKPQLHGMEHVQVPYWMSQLQNKSKETVVAFENMVYGISTTVTSEKRETYLAALNYFSQDEFEEFMLVALQDASKAFYDFFGFKSLSFIAPNYVWSDRVEKTLEKEGVRVIQSSRFQNLPKAYGAKVVRHFIGEKNKNNQIYLVRNAIFEPSTMNNKSNAEAQCFSQIKNAFRFNKPAIISIHRLNFMGGFDKKNQAENLEILNQLLLKIIAKYPEVEFMSSDQLGDIIIHSTVKS